MWRVNQASVMGEVKVGELKAEVGELQAERSWEVGGGRCVMRVASSGEMG